MKIVFRVDASVEIGTGHVMRCLTLANALREQGDVCHFICREHKGHLIAQIEAQGFSVHRLATFIQAELGARDAAPNTTTVNFSLPTHAHWLGVPWQTDVENCYSILETLAPDWLVVDHYGLDARWEKAVCSCDTRLLVIDDLADRVHQADVLLDQTFGRKLEDYRELVPDNCMLLCGSEYALLRPEFAELRSFSLQRRAEPQLRQLLITMGGVDKDNAAGQVIDALRECLIPEDCRITVVMGATAPWLGDVTQRAKKMPVPTEIKVGVSNMAQLMAESDFAIGAAGATSWERCCLGLPTAMLVLAENQKYAARLLESIGAVQMLRFGDYLQKDLACWISDIKDTDVYSKFVTCASDVTYGEGCQLVIKNMISKGSGNEF